MRPCAVKYTSRENKVQKIPKTDKEISVKPLSFPLENGIMKEYKMVRNVKKEI